MTDQSNGAQPATVEVDLGGETLTLSVNLAAATAISRQFGGLRAAFERVQQGDIDAIGFIFAAGSGKQDARAIKDLTNKVFDGGVIATAAPAARFLGFLLGGRQADGA